MLSMRITLLSATPHRLRDFEIAGSWLVALATNEVVDCACRKRALAKIAYSMQDVHVVVSVPWTERSSKERGVCHGVRSRACSNRVRYQRSDGDEPSG